MFKIISKYKKIDYHTKAGIWYVICNIVQKGIAFIVVPIYTHVLTTFEYGQYTVFQSWKDLLMIIVTLNLYCGVFTKAMVDYDKDREKYTSSMQGLTTLLVLVFLLIYLVFKNFWNSLFDMETSTIVMMFIYFLFNSALSFWSVKQRVLYRYKTLIYVSIMSSLLVPVVSLSLLFFTDLRSDAVILGYLIVQSSIGAVFYFVQFFKCGCFFEKKYWVHALRFNIPLIPHYLSLILLAHSDKLMIK